MILIPVMSKLPPTNKTNDLFQHRNLLENKLVIRCVVGTACDFSKNPSNHN